MVCVRAQRRVVCSELGVDGGRGEQVGDAHIMAGLDQVGERKLGVSKPLPSCPEVLSVAMWASPEPQPFFFPSGDHVVFTNCSTEHSHPALSCKMAAEFDAFLASGRR